MGNSNKTIVEGLKAGDKEVLHQLFDQYHHFLVAFARHTVRNPLLAEDFVQDAFCSLWENRGKLNPDLAVQNYLYKSVYNRCVDFLRKQQAQTNYSSTHGIRLKELETMNGHSNPLILSEIFAGEFQEKLQQSVYELPGQTREIFELSRYHEFSNNQIAEKTGLSVKSVEYHISKALQLLRKSLQEFL